MRTPPRPVFAALGGALLAGLLAGCYADTAPPGPGPAPPTCGGAGQDPCPAPNPDPDAEWLRDAHVVEGGQGIVVVERPGPSRAAVCVGMVAGLGYHSGAFKILGIDIGYWRELDPALRARGYGVARFDLACQGSALCPSGDGVTYETQSLLLSRLFEQALPDCGRWILLGHSFGGALVSRACVEKAPRLHGCGVLQWEPYAMLPQLPAGLFDALMREPMVCYDQIRFTGMDGSPTDARRTFFFAPPFTTDALIDLDRKIGTCVPRAALRDAFGHYANSSATRADEAASGVPLLHVQARHDAIYNPGRLNKAWAGRSVETVQIDGGHALEFHTTREAEHAAILSWLDRVQGR